MKIHPRHGVTFAGTVLLTALLSQLGVTNDTADAQTSSLPFQEQGGQVVVEAENFHTTISRGGKSWTAQATPAGFAGAGAMKALPDSGTSINSGYATTSPELQFQIQFATAGTYHVWIRGYAVSGGNTVHVGLNGQPVATSDRVEVKPPNNWVWTKNTMDGPVATLSVPSAGLHTINLWMREDGVSVDRLLLTTNGTFVPSGTGPAESPRSSGGGTTNQPPVVNAGADQTVTLPDSATLSGSAKDDGLPNPPGTLTYTWSKVSGPGIVTFASATSPATTASFSAAGTYTLRLTASDGAATASDDLVVTAQAQTNPLPTTSPFQEQSGQVVMEAENFHTVVNRSGKSWSAQTAPAGFVGASAMQSLPNSGTILDTGYATTSPEMQFQVQFATAGTYHVWLRGYATTTNDNSVHFGVDGQPTTSADRVELLSPLNTWAWSKATMDGPVATLSIPSAGLHTINLWMREDGFYVDRLLLTTNGTFTPSGAGPAESPRSSGGGTTNQPPVVNAGADQTITLPNSAALSGSANDDGLPNPPGALTYAWSKFSGPGTVTFATGSAPSTSASFSAAGTYTLRLTVSDSAATASDDVVVTVLSSTSTASPFQEQSGQVVMEAENFHTSVSRGGKSWSPQTSPSGFVGLNAMQSLPNSGTILDTGYATTSPEMQFQVQFASAGTYHVWIRGYAITTNDNSVHFGVNGQPFSSADRVELLSPLNTWAWSKATMDGAVATLSIPSAGLHTINLWMREDGFYVDRVLLTTSSTFTPSGNGPAESPRSGTTTPTPPAAPTSLTATGGSTAIALAWNASTGATGYNLYRSTTSTVSTSGTPLNGTTPLTATSYSDTAVSGGVTYHYVVTALNSAGSSPASAPASAQLSSSSAVSCTTSSNPTLLTFSSAITGTYGSSGFNCFMPGTDQPTGAGLTLSTSSSHLALASTDGDLFQSTNTQDNALALKIANSGAYAVRARIKGPLGATTAYQSAGVFLALNADNYAKLTVGHGDAGPRLEFAVETAAGFTAGAPDVSFNLANLDQSSEGLDLWLVRNSTGTIEALYRQVTNLTGTPSLGPIVSVGATSAAPSWSTSSTELHGGLLTTDFGAGGSFNTFFDEFHLSAPPSTTAPPSGGWANEMSLPVAVQEVSVAAANNKVYVAGGETETGRVQTLYVFDPASPSWITLAPYPGTARDHMGLAATGGFLYLIGGLTAWPQPSVATVQKYDLATNTWSAAAPLPSPRGAMGVAVINGKIYAAGGLREGLAVTDFTVYDPATNTWQTLPSMPTARDHLVGVALDGKFYAIGGRPGGNSICSPVTTVEMYDPVTNTWSTKSPMSVPRGGHAAGTLNGKIQVFGGEGGQSSCANIASSEEYDPATNTWSPLAPMPIPKHGTGGATIGGKVYLPGGATATGHQPTSTHQSFTQAASQPTSPPAAPTGLTATGGSTAIALAWNASSGATGYNVYRGTTTTVSTTGTPLNGATPLTTTSYSDSAASAGITYSYVVTAVNAAGSSPASNTASAQLTSSSTVTCTTSSNPTLLSFSSAVAGTYGSSGFNCFMPGSVQPTGAGLALNAAGSHLTVTSTDGDLFQGTNTQNNALALKLANSGTYAVRVRIKGPFSATTAFQSAGVVLALNADNYAKLTIGQGNAGPRFEFAVETAAVFTAAAPDAAFNPASVDQASEAIDLWLVRNSNGIIEALYRQVTNLTTTPVLGPIVSLGATSSAPSWSVSSAELYGGLLTTDFGAGGAFDTFVDEFQLGGAPASEPPTSPPAAPTGLTATGGTSAIALAWNASTGATGYNVFRSTTSTVSTSGTPLNGSTPLTTTSYSDAAVSAGTVYHYAVTALNSAGSSPPSATASAQLGSSSTITCAASANPTLLNFSGTVAGTYGSSGFNCFMPGTVQPTGSGLVLSGFNSHLVVTSTEGDIFQSSNDQNNALALKFANSASYAVRVRIKGPFSATTAFQSAGVFLALNADNYAKLAVGQGTAGPRLEFAVETGGSFAPAAADVTFNAASLDTASEALDLWLVRKADGTIEALYRQITNLTSSPVLGPIVSIGATSTAPSWASSSAELYGGLLTTDFGAAGAFDTFFDEFQLGGPVSQSSTPAPTSFTKKTIAKSGTTSGTAFGINGFDNPTSLELGPDGKLYVATQSGKIYILTLDHQQLPTTSGMAVTHVQTLNEIFNRTTLTCNIGGNPSNCQFVSGTPTGRLVAGLAIGPESTPQQMVLYVTHSDPRIGENSSSTAMAIDTWSGTITRLYLQPGSGGNYVVTNQQDLVVGLPRSRENHGPNGIAFGPDGWMYFTVGGNTNYGKPSTFFSMLPEYYLAAAALRLNVTGLGTALPLNVKGVASASGMTQFAGKLELFATGFRNAYDLVWHSNGSLYVNDNAGNSGLGNTPDSADGCSTPSINPGTLPDTLEKVTQGSYGGHPNPVRGECVLDSGSHYSPPLPADPQYAAPLLAYNQGASTNGIVEYTSTAFNGALQGNLISATYAGNQNVRRVVLNASGTGVVQEVNLGTFSQPLDVTTDGTGIIYVAEHGADQVTVLIPAQAGTTCPSAATSDDDGDGFSDADEAAHGTDPCSSASFPPDLDGDFIGNLSDSDLDGDGVVNTSDQLHFDPQNGAATALPVAFEWNPGNSPLGGIANTGFTGAQIASSGPRVATSSIHVGAAGGFMSLDTAAGSPDGSLNNQVNALQVGFNSTAAFTISGRIVEPFNSVAAAPGHLAGIFFGPNQNNFLRIGIVGETNGQKAVQLAFEQGGVFSEAARVPLPSGPVLNIDLFLVANPNTQVISAYYELNQSGTMELVAQLAVPATWFTNNQGAAANTSLAGVVSSHGAATPITFVYDFFRIQATQTQAAASSAGGPGHAAAGTVYFWMREERVRGDAQQ